ncbi:hypothetical protein [Streptomyces sp. NPDC047130]|uniref:hypothetical protein n=1 Tax=Streptomyces sp. NPDC047130 TaxID=3155261 RepID=UPI0033C31EAB
MTGAASYTVWHGDTPVGELRDVSSDQPWVHGRFTPGAGWEPLAPLFAAVEEWARQGFPEHLVSALAAVRDLELELRPVAGGPAIRPWMIHIADGQARFRE